ncbi:SHOCT domain-containing protein [Kitasatospora sp. NBC_01560]|uniref:SHOCT domain-containing protein n=1 Tax=Kitasatospora sp. NBC_01560 TaxID=2975965 RepID=UPI0038660728
MYTLLADHDGHWPGPWILLIPLAWAAVVFLVILLLRRTVWRRGCWAGAGAGADHPLAVLGRRFAEGDIDAEEYRARRAVLTEPHRTRDDGSYDGRFRGGAAK